MSNHNPLTETYSQFKTRKFNQGKIDGFAEACELVERQYGWLTKDVFSVLLLWRVFVWDSLPRFVPEYYWGYYRGINLAYRYFGGKFGGTNAQR